MLSNAPADSGIDGTARGPIEALKFAPSRALLTMGLYHRQLGNYLFANTKRVVLYRR
jgi:hypothetical protein